MFARRVTATVLLFALLSTPLVAQETPRLGETLDISIVNVDVFVTDRAGNRVRGLTQADFEIFENGQPQAISNFAEYVGDVAKGTVSVDAPSRTAAEAAEAESAPREKRTILLFFEQTRLANFRVEKLMAALKQTIRDAVQPGDAVSIVLWSRGGIVHTEFTDDLRVVDGALDRIGSYAVKAEIDITSQHRAELEQLRAFEAGIAAMAENADSIPMLPASDMNASVSLYMMMAYNEMQARVAAINSAINTMSGFDGKKILLLATRRLGEIAGAEYFHLGGSGLISEELRFRYRTDHLMQSITDNANASGITIYPLNLTGLPDVFYDASRSTLPSIGVEQAAAHLTLSNETMSLRKIAARTGGLSAAGSVDIVNLLPRVADDLTDYYSLAYRVPSTGGDFTRNIEVKTRNRDYVVRSRKDFVEKSEDTRMRDRIRATLFRAQQDSDIDITATSGAKKKVRGIAMMPVQVRIPISDLTVLPQGEGKHAGKFSVYVAAAADLDELSDVTQKTQPFEITETDLEQANAGHFTYDLDVQIDKKTKYLAVGVFDEVGRSYGTVRLDVKPEQKVQ